MVCLDRWPSAELCLTPEWPWTTPVPCVGLLVVADRRHRHRHRSPNGVPAREAVERELESCARYRQRVRRVAELTHGFEERLHPEQKQLWLLVEEALLEHFRLSCQEYFAAGARYAAAHAAHGQASHRNQRARERELLQLVRALVRVLRE